MLHWLLADLVVLLHFGFVLFAVFGGFLVLRSRCWAWLHVPAFLWAGFIELSGGICPLTPLENGLRVRGGLSAYRGDFIDHYLIPLLYPEDLTRGIQLLLGAAVLLLNAAIYALVWFRSRRNAKP